MNFNNMKLSGKMALAFSVVVSVVIVVSVMIYASAAQHATQDRNVSDASEAHMMIERLNGDMYRAAYWDSYFALTDNPAAAAKVQDAVTAYENGITTIRAKTSAAPQLASLIDAMDAARKAWQAHKDEARIKGYEAAAGAAAKAVDDWSRGESVKSQRSLATMQLTVAIGALAAASLAVIVGVLLTKAIGGPVNGLTVAMRKLASGDNSVEVPAADRKDEIGDMARAVMVFKDSAIEKIRLEGQTIEQRKASEAERADNEAERAESARRQASVVASIAEGLDRLANGDLTYRLSTAFASEYEQLRADFNMAMQKLEETIMVVSTNTSAINAGSDELAQASDDLSRRTEQQAASLEETAAALDEITATVRKSAAGAKQASDVVTQARGEAEHSGDVVAQAVKAMGEIEKSSQEISQIIGVIDEIAFQTNLLALNAGVEAARAGDAGRGFAVVAQEVRALAQRSAEAAKEIKSLISTSSQQVGEGVNLVGATGKALASIVGKVSEIDALVSEIAASAMEQSTGLAEVNGAINQMDQVVQQNAAMVEQSAAATHSLKGEAGELANLISRFKVSMGQTAARSAPRPASARSTPSPSPARALARKVAANYGGAQVATGSDSWEEF